MFIPLVSLFQVFILLPPTLALHFDVALLCSLHCVSLLTFTCLFSFQTFLLPHILLCSALSPIFPHLSASHSSFDCQLASLSAASFFDPPLLSQSLNTFNLLSSSLICHSIHSALPFIISPYRLPPSVLLLLSACLKDGFKDPLSPLSPSSQKLIHSYTPCSHC